MNIGFYNSPKIMLKDSMLFHNPVLGLISVLKSLIGANPTLQKENSFRFQ